MKFGDKYELLDSLTTGGVETFVANDKVRGERVLVHILHCDPQRANQPTVQWVLESFRRVAPEPVGLVLETGRYSGTLYAYVVTKLPEDAALQAWVRQYQTHACDTQEVTSRPLVPTPESLAPTADHNPPPPPSPPLSSVTQLLREFEPQAQPGAPIAPPQPTIEPPPPPPNFASSADRSGVRMAAPPTWNAEIPRTPVAPKADPPRSSPPDRFPDNFLDKNFPAEASTPPVKDSPKLGEFTSFFHGPFRGDRPSETPQISSPPEPPRKTVGDFTAMFGAAKPQPPEEPLPPKGIAGNEPAGTGFTGWFNPNANASSRISDAPSGPITPPGLPRAAADSAPFFPDPPRPDPPKPDPPRQSFVPPQPVSSVAPPPPIFPAPAPPIPPMPSFPMPSLPTVKPSPLPSDGATHAFSQPGAEPIPAVPLPPVGPSAYTQIISVRAPSPGADAAGAPKDESKTLTPPAFKLPPPPPMPVFAAPAPPPLPKAPKVQIPPPPISYWPLVLTLTVSFAVAVLLVLYFWLKH